MKLKSPYSDGTTYFEFTPEQFIKRMIAIIPQPRQNFIRYFGVFGARHRKRSVITSMARTKITKSSKVISKKKVYRSKWADLLKRVFKYEVLNCDSCSGQLKFVACITSPTICKKILDHLNLDSTRVKSTPARAPPLEFEDLYTIDEFNQESSW